MGNKQLMKNFNLIIAKGEKVIFSAPSGSGKSSLLRLVLGFTDTDEGKILFNQKEVKAENLRKIRQQVGYLSQDIDFPNGKVTDVFQEIFSYAANKHLHYSEEKLIEKLKEVNLSEDILKKNTSDISGGERQRLGWVLIMLLERSVWLLDEPTSAMDDKQKQFFIDYISKSKKTVVCVSHDPDWQKPDFTLIKSLLE